MSGILTGPHFIAYFNNPSRAEIGTMVAILELGALLSSLLVGKIGDVIGRRRTIRYGALIFIIGGLIQTCARKMLDLVFGRVISGIGVGILSTIVPVYQSEVSAPKNRGRLGCIQFTGNIVGYSSSVWVDYVCSALSSNYSWRIPLFIQCIIGSMLYLGSFIIVETPRWLLSSDNDVEGIIVIANLHSKGDTNASHAKDEYQAIKKDVLTHRLDGETKGYGYMWRKYKRRVITGCLCLMFAQFNGINVISYYAPLVFEQAGWKGRQAILMTGINSLIYVASTVLPWFIVDKYGRRPILLTGAAIMFFSLAGIAFIIWLNIPSTPFIVVILVIIFNGPGFGTSWGPLAWFIPSEILPVSVRSLGASCATACNWIANFIVGEMTPILQESLGWKLYLIHAASCLLSFCFVFFYLPETAGVSLEDMNSVFGDGASSVFGDNASSYAPINDSDSFLGGFGSGNNGGEESLHENDRLYNNHDENLYYNGNGNGNGNGNINDDEESLMRGSQSFVSTAALQRDPGLSKQPNLEFQSLNALTSNVSIRPSSSSVIMPEDVEPPGLEEVLKFKQRQAVNGSIKGSIRRGSESVSNFMGKVFNKNGKRTRINENGEEVEYDGDDVSSFDIRSSRSRAFDDDDDQSSIHSLQQLHHR